MQASCFQGWWVLDAYHIVIKIPIWSWRNFRGCWWASSCWSFFTPTSATSWSTERYQSCQLAAPAARNRSRHLDRSGIRVLHAFRGGSVEVGVRRGDLLLRTASAHDLRWRLQPQEEGLRQKLHLHTHLRTAWHSAGVRYSVCTYVRSE